MEHGFAAINKQDMHDAIQLVTQANKTDSAIRWLESLPPWDGVNRVKHFFSRYCGAEKSAFTRSVSTYLWTGLAGRVLIPGIKADIMVVLQGRQGCYKSSLVEALAPDPAQYTEVNFGLPDTTIYRATKGKIVVEAAELSGMGKRDLESLKAFLTRQSDRYAGKWKERAEDFPRRYMIIGTTNDDAFLTDVENRRFAVVHVERIDVKKVREDFVQLWAEARELFNANGVMWQGVAGIFISRNSYNL